jgi:hypothetical protein
MDLTRRCLECSKPFFGRSDKKFCSDVCRNACNNRHRSLTSPRVRVINNILNKNRKILEQNFSNGADTIQTTKYRLLEQGFNFNYVTGVSDIKNGSTCFYCYEFGYQMLDQDTLMLIRKG